MNVFRGIFNRMNNRSGSGGNRRPGGDGSDSDGDVGRQGPTGPQQARPPPPRRLPRQFNSDWNTVVEEQDTNLFFNIFGATQQAVSDAQHGSKNTLLSRNQTKVKRQLLLQRRASAAAAAAVDQAKKEGSPEEKVANGDDQEMKDESKSDPSHQKVDDVKAAGDTDKASDQKDQSVGDKSIDDKPDHDKQDGSEAQPLLGGGVASENKDDSSNEYLSCEEGEEEAPDKEDGGNDSDKANPIVDAARTSLQNDEDQEESKQDQEESKSATNERLKDHRLFEFVQSTKYSEFYQRLIPNKLLKSIRADDARVYGGRFTQKGNLYYCSSQESINLYDTRDPYNWSLKSQIEAQNISWTVTDMDVSPDEQFMVYSSIDPYVRLVDLDTMRRKQEFINLGDSGENNRWGGGRVAIMSLKLSGDGKEILCGTKGAHLMVYDLIANKMVTKVDGCHSDEINSVCFANRQHSNIIFSGSDDGMVKVWDRRALSSNRPAGVFVGHSEGVTNVASKGDGIYLASNGKDQLLKVWDIRQSVSYDKFQGMALPRQDPGFDYRYGQRHRMLNRQQKHFADKSVFTFKGHAVYSTLIRCQFSPLETTGQRYVYTGSSDGNLHIFDLVTGDTAGVLRKRSPGRQHDMYGQGNASPARDISWHPFMPVLASTEFTGHVNIWSMQNIGEEERQKMQQQAQTKEEDQQEDTEEEKDEEEEEDDDSDPLGVFGRGGGGGQFVMVRGANGQAYRVPMSLLRQLMARDDNAANEDEDEEEESQPAAAQSQQSLQKDAEKSDNDDPEEEEKKEPVVPKKGDSDTPEAEDWDMDDVSWGEDDIKKDSNNNMMGEPEPIEAPDAIAQSSIVAAGEDEESKTPAQDDSSAVFDGAIRNEAQVHQGGVVQTSINAAASGDSSSDGSGLPALEDQQKDDVEMGGNDGDSKDK